MTLYAPSYPVLPFICARSLFSAPHCYSFRYSTHISVALPILSLLTGKSHCPGGGICVQRALRAGGNAFVRRGEIPVELPPLARLVLQRVLPRLEGRRVTVLVPGREGVPSLAHLARLAVLRAAHDDMAHPLEGPFSDPHSWSARQKIFFSFLLDKRSHVTIPCSGWIQQISGCK